MRLALIILALSFGSGDVTAETGTTDIGNVEIGETFTVTPEMIGAPTIEADPAPALIAPVPTHIKLAIPAPISSSDEPVLANEVHQTITSNFAKSGRFELIEMQAFPDMPQDFDEPLTFEDWASSDADAVLITEVERTVGTDIAIRFRLYDISEGQPLGDGLQYDAPATSQRRAAHKLSDRVYQRLTVQPGYFDSQIAYIEESGPKAERVTRLAIMDQDGENRRYLTDGTDLVFSPAIAPDGMSLSYVTFASGIPQIESIMLDDYSTQPITNASNKMAFSPDYAPLEKHMIYALEENGNTDIWLLDLKTAATRRLTTAPSIETSPSISPDGKHYVFESDRSGAPQLYVAPIDGSKPPERISFGEGRYGTPVWSPNGDLIAFSHQLGDELHIGIMKSDGSAQRQLTNGHQDENPDWSPNSNSLVFNRRPIEGEMIPRLYSIALNGHDPLLIETEFGASDASWGPVLP